MVGKDENSYRSGSFCSFVLCVSLLVSSIIWLNRINHYIDNGDSDSSFLKPQDPNCVPELIPANSTSTPPCANLNQWKTFAILGIVRGSLYTLQILSNFICTRIMTSPVGDEGGDAAPQRVKKRKILAYCVIFILSTFLSLIPIYLVFHLYRASAIYSTLPILAKPAMTIFVICILELVGLIFLIFCLGPCLIGAACCAVCCVCLDHRGRERTDAEQQMPMKPVK